MQTYRDYQPTVFDRKGAFLPDRQDWIVCPVIQTRDSGPLDRSNFRVVLADLGGESETVEVHRFGHWGPGWYEIIIVHPDLADKVEEWEAALSDYPVASDDDYSELEYEEASEYWARMSARDRLDAIKRSGARCSIFAAAHDYLPSDDSGELISYLTGC